MIITTSKTTQINPQILRRACCPVCLSDLEYSIPAEQEQGLLTCLTCHSRYLETSGLPVMLVNDENWRKKADEIHGEVVYNTKKTPMEVHQQRNIFVDRNSQLFLDEAKVDFSNKQLLIIGCSMSELEFFSGKSSKITCLDIVPNLTMACHQATKARGISADWICGDGECLPFEDEGFDLVIVRQALHHMLKYYTAISEFFRVCKVGGQLLIIDEPFSALDSNDMAANSLPDDFLVYDQVSLGQIRKLTGIRRNPLNQQRSQMDFNELEKHKAYIQGDQQDPESFLADKYHAFSLLNCLYALKFHTNDVSLTWPREIGWTDDSGETIRFCHGSNPQYADPLAKRLISTGNVSVSARKLKQTTVRRNRNDVQAISIETAKALLLRG
jgi:SAM-dependent methyltransferase